MSADPLEEREKLVLAAVLGSQPERAAARALLARDGGAESEVRALHAGLARSGRLLRDSTGLGPKQEARFVARVLARTTRQDPSWRGDARLWLDFLRARLAASPALRLLAASIVLHLVAAPVVAYWVLREPERRPRFTIHIEQPTAEPFAPPPPAASPGPDELRAAAWRREARESELARQRYVLQARARSAPTLATEAPFLEARLLAARARFLSSPGDSSAGAGREPPPEALGPLALALWAEGALDRLVLRGVGADELAPACPVLARVALDRELEARAPATVALVRAALQRAQGLGLCPGSSPDSVGLLAPAWFDALRRAWREGGLESCPEWTAWLAWGQP